MSFQAMTWAVDHELPAMQKIVLMMMANRFNDEDVVFDYSLNDLAKDCGMDRRSVIRQVKSLIDAGLIEKVYITDIKAYELLNNNHSYGCQFCGCSSHNIEEHHYPIRNKDGGNKTISICLNCHGEFHRLTDYGLFKITNKEA